MMYFLMSFYLLMLSIYFLIMFLKFLIFKTKMIFLWNLMMINSMKIEYILYLDWMSFLFMSTVLMISSMVILYSTEYMKMDKSLKRFMWLIIIFVLSMIFMIISMNMFSILLGWDGLGLSSYCLVAYYKNKKSFNSSMITILMNRVGDIMIILSIGLMMYLGSLNFMMLNNLNLMILYLILIAAITKSAQIPFSPWLPMAMTAPTPISALVHSSTLVTAGVYLMIRFNHLMNKNFMFFLFILSMLTMFMAGLTANFEYDFKKIIALSTLSQLGLMMMTISLNLTKLTFFHLVTHAMFKSLLFLCAGIIIHNYFNNQDIRFISILNFKFPFIYSTFNIATLTLCGLPFLSGFYSKDMIIEMFNMMSNNYLMYTMMYLSMGTTVSYSFRLIFYISLKSPKMNNMSFYLSNNMMNYSLLILLIMSMFYGSIINWILFSSLNKIFLTKMMKLIIFFILMFMMLLMLILNNIKMNKIFYKNIIIFKFMNMMWLLPLLDKKIKMKLIFMSNKFNYFNDMGWLEQISSKKIINKIMIMYKFKNIFKLNMMLMMMFLSYLMLIMKYY
nr:NADH dehydrogenase subunit 5 [Aphidius gifuensis]WLE68597.1 NADH dehydrogenase subunit 5 [Aphidius gifuensis]WLE68649.1 NADH dehydrogenase subunit 5 [Aphidius gifuensis]WLE68688.1 NADH dehydrogenase subunit 5 [Aphidius gifuensis]WLE70690.1 NADH dehydrogenase subunit 5 [Aphidius gifuensis]